MMAPQIFAARGWILVLLLILSQSVALATESPQGPGQATPAPRGQPVASAPARHGARPNMARSPSPSIEPYVRPELAQRMQRLRPAILAAAKRHNRPALSGMDDAEFAATIATIIYNENFGWLEDDIAPLRPFTPLYQDIQRRANQSPLGSNFSVWPTNLRPSVALEILRQQLPISGTQTITVPVRVAGSRIDPAAYGSQEELYAAITAEISQDSLAMEYLAANLERGLYRAQRDGAPVSWRTLAAWHNQGIVDPRQIRDSPTASDYVRRASAYLPLARELVRPQPWRHPPTRRI